MADHEHTDPAAHEAGPTVTVHTADTPVNGSRPGSKSGSPFSAESVLLQSPATHARPSPLVSPMGDTMFSQLAQPATPVNRVSATEALRNQTTLFGMPDRTLLTLHKFNRNPTQRFQMTLTLADNGNRSTAGAEVHLVVDCDEEGSPVSLFCQRFKEHCLKVHEQYSITKLQRRHYLQGRARDWAFENDVTRERLVQFYEAMRNVPISEMSLVNNDHNDGRFLDVVENEINLTVYVNAGKKGSLPGVVDPNEPGVRAGHLRLLLCLSASDRLLHGKEPGGGEKKPVANSSSEEEGTEKDSNEDQEDDEGRQADAGGVEDFNKAAGRDSVMPGSSSFYTLTPAEQEAKSAMFRRLAREQRAILEVIKRNDAGRGRFGEREWAEKVRDFPRKYNREPWDHIRDWLGEICDEGDFYAAKDRAYEEKLARRMASE
ncbi:unnamed protein product [Amoebophrya sp. A120]|nr:unnamed protein product [Amoebophrya sp. A120]|eukprot:GSA120T00002564001.1